jgi:hypothetical protein
MVRISVANNTKATTMRNRTYPISSVISTRSAAGVYAQTWPPSGVDLAKVGCGIDSCRLQISAVIAETSWSVPVVE